VAGCFPRRETRQSCGQMISGLLMEMEDHNCWTIAEAVGHRGPHRLQHFLSRAVWDDQQVLDTASAWAVSHLDDGDGVLIVDETADEKSSADAAGAARQYSGIALCQVAVTLTYAARRGHALIGRALYLPEGFPAHSPMRRWYQSRASPSSSGVRTDTVLGPRPPKSIVTAKDPLHRAVYSNPSSSHLALALKPPGRPSLSLCQTLTSRNGGWLVILIVENQFGICSSSFWRASSSPGSGGTAAARRRASNAAWIARSFMLMTGNLAAVDR
jgi:hypothetical protein